MADNSHRTAVFVDGDETLFHRQDCSSASEKPKHPHAVQIQFQGRHYYVVARPSARQFLECVRSKHGKPDMVTSGWSEFQSLVLEALGLRSAIGEVHGRVYEMLTEGANWEPLDTPAHVVLVDDLDPRHDGLHAKLAKLGHGEGSTVTHIRCCKYFGTIHDPGSLMELLPAIDAALEA